MRIAIVAPVTRGGSGGFIRTLGEVVQRWRRNPRIESIRIHVPKNVCAEADGLGVEVERYAVRRVGPVSLRHIPGVRMSPELVVLVLGARPIVVPPAPLVTLVRNVEPLQERRYESSALWQLRLWALRQETLRAAQQATRVVAVSRYVKERLVWHGVAASKIDVVYHGGGTPTGAEERPLACASLRGPFLFAAGSIVPYRGLEDLIRAVAILKARKCAAPEVVIGGSGNGGSRSYERWIRGLGAELGVENLVVWAGQLSSAEMTWCFRHAAATVQTSRAEAFSLFQVEAMYAGAVLISCTQPPMPEILEDGAEYYSTGDSRELAEILVRVQSGVDDGRASRRAAGMRRAAAFTWDREAEDTLKSLEAAFKQHLRGGR